MTAVKKRRGTRVLSLTATSLIKDLPELLDSALAREDDLIITYETDPESGRKTLHVITGKLVSACMLNRLRSRIEAYPEDGSRILSGKWKQVMGNHRC
jgi:hypothetical protein